MDKIHNEEKQDEIANEKIELISNNSLKYTNKCENKWDQFKKKAYNWWEELKNKALQRKKYMITPCKHLFHSECLEIWMELKNICPVCRSEIPSYL